MAYIGSSPIDKGTGLFSQDTFTGDGSTVAFDLSNIAPDGGGNDIQVFVDNVRQQEGSSKAYTLGQDGSGDLKRITFTAAPAASASIFVLNPGTKNVQQISTISDNAVTTAKVQDSAITAAKISEIPNDSVNATKIADNAISEEHLDTTAVTGLSALGEGAATADTIIVFDASAGVLKKVTQNNFLNFPTVTSVSPTNVVSGDGTGNYTFVITGAGFTGASASLVNNSGTIVNFDTVTVNSGTQITGVVAKSSLPGSGEPYDVRVTAATGLRGTLENQINIDQSPTYNTAAGSVGTVPDSARTSTTIDIEAFDPESAGNVTFEIQSGSLPAGATTSTVNENGVSKFRISGTFTAVGSDTTSNFTLRAVDAASNTTSRAFSIQVLAPAYQSFTSSGTFSVPSGVTAVNVLVVAGGGGSGSAQNDSVASGGGGAGGLIYVPAFSVTPGGTVTVTVGCGGTHGAPSHNAGENGDDSAFGTLTAKGGGGGASHGTGPFHNGPGQGGIGNTGGSGGGGATGGPAAAGTATQPTQPGQSGAYGFGNPGGDSQGYAPASNQLAGGGGGAGGAGQPGASGSDGGVGKAYTIADGTTSVYYAGGGGGGGTGTPSGGQGGGGQGGNYPAGNGQAGQANKGGGAGGSAVGTSPNQQPGNTGGKGIVIVNY